jgi:uncharacterized membrane protein (UPF0127 family)
MKTIRIENRNLPLPTPLQATCCESFPGRLRGLMFHSGLVHEEGLLLVERFDSRIGSSIHMLFVPMDLAVIWINSKRKVVDTFLARSWHSTHTPRQPARYILEIRPSRFNEFKIGDQIEFQNV